MAVLDFVKNIDTSNYFGGGSLKDNPVIGMKPDLISAVGGISKTPEQKAEGLSEGDINDAAYEAQQAGYEAVSDRVLQMTGLDMKNAEDRAKLCEHYYVDVAREQFGWPSDSTENEFDNALRSYSELAVDEESRGKGNQVDFDSLPEKNELESASDMTYGRVSSSEFANEVYEKSGLDMNDSEDREALSKRVKEFEPLSWSSKVNPMMGRARDCIDYASDHHADIDKDSPGIKPGVTARDIADGKDIDFEEILRNTAASLGVDTAAQQMLAGASHFVDSLESKVDPKRGNAAVSLNEGKEVDSPEL